MGRPFAMKRNYLRCQGFILCYARHFSVYLITYKDSRHVVRGGCYFTKTTISHLLGACLVIIVNLPSPDFY